MVQGGGGVRGTLKDELTKKRREEGEERKRENKIKRDKQIELKPNTSRLNNMLYNRISCSSHEGRSRAELSRAEPSRAGPSPDTPVASSPLQSQGTGRICSLPRKGLHADTNKESMTRV